MRLQALGDPRLMTQLRQVRRNPRCELVANRVQANPEFATAIQEGGERFREIVRHQEDNMRRAELEKNRQIELLNADPYDIEVRSGDFLRFFHTLTSQAQKKIEEAIRMEAVLENMQHAMEYSVRTRTLPPSY